MAESESDFRITTDTPYLALKIQSSWNQNTKFSFKKWIWKCLQSITHLVQTPVCLKVFFRKNLWEGEFSWNILSGVIDKLYNLFDFLVIKITPHVIHHATYNNHKRSSVWYNLSELETYNIITSNLLLLITIFSNNSDIRGPLWTTQRCHLTSVKARSHSALRLNHGQNPSKSGLLWSRRCCSRWCWV